MVVCKYVKVKKKKQREKNRTETLKSLPGKSGRVVALIYPQLCVMLLKTCRAEEVWADNLLSCQGRNVEGDTQTHERLLLTKTASLLVQFAFRHLHI